MQLKLNVSDFSKKFAQGSSMAAKNQQMPVFENSLVQVKNGKALITSSNMETTIVTRCNVECDGDTEFCINPKDLMSIMKTLKGDENVILEVYENHVVLRHTKGEVTLPTMNAGDFQKPVIEDGITFFDASSEVLYTLLNEARNFTAKDEVRPIMGGVRIVCGNGTIHVSSTDANVLYDNERASDCQNDEMSELIVSANVIPTLLSMIDGTETTKVGNGETNMVFKTSDCKIITRNLQGKYPNVGSVIPKSHEISIKMNKGEISNAISRVMVTANSATKTIILEIKDGSLKIISEDLDYAKKSFEEFMNVSEGGNIKIGVNGGKLQTCLSQVSGSDVVFELTDSRHAIVIKEAFGNEKTILVMPVNIGQ